MLRCKFRKDIFQTPHHRTAIQSPPRSWPRRILPDLGVRSCFSDNFFYLVIFGDFVELVSMDLVGCPSARAFIALSSAVGVLVGLARINDT